MSRRSSSPAARGVALLWALAAVFSASARAESDGGGASAEALMRRLEAPFRSQARLLRMSVESVHERWLDGSGKPRVETLDLWGAVGDVGGTTAVLYVFESPAWMRGMGLLLRDRWTPAAAGESGEGDEMWYRMRTYRRFKRVPPENLKLRVPGTCLTYEDAFGLPSGDRYVFELLAGREGAEGAVILARPRSPELAANVGYRSLRLTLDPERRYVARIEYTGENGATIKTFEASRPALVGDVWLATRARLVDLENSLVSEIRYTFWPLADAVLPAALFDPAVEDDSLLERFVATFAALGLELGSLEPRPGEREARR